MAERARIWVAPAALIWVAAAAIAIGFLLIVYTWDKVSTLTIVAQQIPYIVSAGFTGLGLIITGAAALVVCTRRGDDNARRQQTEALVGALAAIREALEEPGA